MTGLDLAPIEARDATLDGYHSVLDRRALLAEVKELRAALDIEKGKVALAAALAKASRP